MSWSSDDARDITVRELANFDIGRRVRFNRPRGSQGAPVILGKLIRVERENYYRGSMPRIGFRLTIGFSSKWGGFNYDSFGPVPGSYKIHVGPKWVERKTKFELELEEELDEIYGDTLT